MGSRKLYDADRRASSFVTLPQVLLEAGTPSVSVAVHQKARFQAEMVAIRRQFGMCRRGLVRDLQCRHESRPCRPPAPSMGSRGPAGPGVVTHLVQLLGRSLCPRAKNGSQRHPCIRTQPIVVRFNSGLNVSPRMPISAAERSDVPDSNWPQRAMPLPRGSGRRQMCLDILTSVCCVVLSSSSWSGGQ